MDKLDKKICIHKTFAALCKYIRDHHTATELCTFKDILLSILREAHETPKSSADFVAGWTLESMPSLAQCAAPQMLTLCVDMVHITNVDRKTGSRLSRLGLNFIIHATQNDYNNYEQFQRLSDLHATLRAQYDQIQAEWMALPESK